MKTYTYEHLQIAHRAGQRNIALDEALTAFALCADLMKPGDETPLPARVGGGKEKPLKASRKRRAPQGADRGERSDVSKRTERVLAYLEEVGDGGARVDRIAEAVDADKRTLAKWLWWGANRGGVPGLRKLGKSTYAYEKPQA